MILVCDPGEPLPALNGKHWPGKHDGLIQSTGRFGGSHSAVAEHLLGHRVKSPAAAAKDSQVKDDMKDQRLRGCRDNSQPEQTVLI